MTDQLDPLDESAVKQAVDAALEQGWLPLSTTASSTLVEKIIHTEIPEMLRTLEGGKSERAQVTGVVGHPPPVHQVPVAGHDRPNHPRRRPHHRPCRRAHRRRPAGQRRMMGALLPRLVLLSAAGFLVLSTPLLAGLGGIVFAIEEAEAVHGSTGRVSAVTWSKVQQNSLLLQQVQASTKAAGVVVDDDGRLLGTVRPHDVLDVITQTDRADPASRHEDEPRPEQPRREDADATAGGAP